MRRFLILLAAAAGMVVAAAPAYAQPTVTIDSGKLVNDFQAQVTGTVTCDPGNNFAVNVELRQRPSTSAFGGSSFQPCTGSPQQWTVTTYPSNRALHPGKAVVFAGVSVCDPDFFQCTFTETSRELHLKK